ncbi:hypothetical protein D3C85_1378600 [compost metagenome]
MVVREIIGVDALRRQNGAPRGIDVPALVAILHRIAAVAQQVVPHHLVAILRYREGIARLDVFHPQATVDGFSGQRIRRRVLLHLCRHGHGAMRRVDIDTEGRIALHQRLDSLGESLAVLIHVLRVNRVQRLLHREGIWTFPRIRLEPAGRRRQTTGIGRNRTIGVAGHLRTHGSQPGTELLGFGLRHRGLSRARYGTG